MALTRISIRAQDFAREVIPNLKLVFHPQKMANQDRTANLFVDKTITLGGGPQQNFFYVDLEAGYRYRLEAVWTDQARVRQGQSWWSGAFEVPTSSSQIPISDLVGLPEGNGKIRVTDGPPASRESAEFVIDETTGDLYVRRGGSR